MPKFPALPKHTRDQNVPVEPQPKCHGHPNPTKDINLPVGPQPKCQDLPKPTSEFTGHSATSAKDAGDEQEISNETRMNIFRNMPFCRTELLTQIVGVPPDTLRMVTVNTWHM